MFGAKNIRKILTGAEVSQADFGSCSGVPALLLCLAIYRAGSLCGARDLGNPSVANAETP